MRTLRIDFTAENMLPDGDSIGRIGEHNATSLIITPPAEMAECEDIINYVAAFVTEGKIIRSDFYPKAEQITIPLCSQLTQDHTLGIQLEGYDGAGGLVVKSAIISELKLLPSAGGDETDFNGEDSGIISQINLNTLSRHSHSNGDVLSCLGEKNGTLTYNGQPITSKKTKTIELDVKKGEAFVESTGTGFLFYISDINLIPEKTEITNIEYYFEHEKIWKDLMSVIEYDYTTPVLVQIFKTFNADGFMLIAHVHFYKSLFSDFFHNLMNNRLEKLRVTYVVGSPE